MCNKSVILVYYTGIWLCLSGLLSGCTHAPASIVTPQSITVTKEQGNTQGWRSVAFKLAWQKGTEPDWTIGTLIAGEIIAPQLGTLRSDIIAWRIHRRAVDDGTGHTFRVWVYCSAATAAKLFNAIKHDTVTQELQRTGKVVQLDIDPVEQNPKPNIEDTSDPLWPLPIRKTWPTYIMGVSQMWLDLVVQLSKEQATNGSLYEHYHNVQQHISTLWRQHGQHAWLHHLSGIYGYSPVEMHF